MVMITNSTAPVANVLQRRAMAPFPPASFAAMMPEPTTAMTKKPVPNASAAKRRVKSKGTSRPPISPPRALPQQQPPLELVAAGVTANGMDVPQPEKIP